MWCNEMFRWTPADSASFGRRRDTTTAGRHRYGFGRWSSSLTGGRLIAAPRALRLAAALADVMCHRPAVGSLRGLWVTAQPLVSSGAAGGVATGRQIVESRGPALQVAERFPEELLGVLQVHERWARQSLQGVPE